PVKRCSVPSSVSSASSANEIPCHLSEAMTHGEGSRLSSFAEIALWRAGAVSLRWSRSPHVGYGSIGYAQPRKPHNVVHLSRSWLLSVKTLAEMRRSASAKEVHSASSRSRLAVIMKQAPGYVREIGRAS